MQTGTTVWLKERDWDTGQTSLDEPGSHAGVEQCHKQYGDGGEGDCEAEGVPASGSLPRRGVGGFRDRCEATGLPLKGRSRPNRA
jgi:hypothetical protein